MGDLVIYLTKSPLVLVQKEKVLKLDNEYLNNITNVLDLNELYILNGNFSTTVKMCT